MQIFFAEILEITSSFILANKNLWGLVHFKHVLKRFVTISLFKLFLSATYNVSCHNLLDMQTRKQRDGSHVACQQRVK